MLVYSKHKCSKNDHKVWSDRVNEYVHVVQLTNKREIREEFNNDRHIRVPDIFMFKWN